MGCCSSRVPSWDESLESNILTELERSLGYYNYTSKEMNEKFHQFSVEGKIHSSNFKELCSSLSLKFDKFSDLYSKFADGSAYILKKLTCLGVLLGRGEAEEKLTILFENYQNSNSKTMTSEKLKEMLDHLAFVSCSVIPGYAASQNKENEELKLYVSNLLLISNVMVNQLAQIILEDKPEISLDELIKCFKRNSDVENIVNSNRLREYGNGLYLNLTGAPSGASDPQSVSERNSTMERLSRNDQPKKELKQRKTFSETPLVPRPVINNQSKPI